MLKLNDHYYSLAWHPRVSQKKLEQDQPKQIWTPDTPLPAPEPYLVHFSTIRDAQEYSWIWLFSDVLQALRLRVLVDLLDQDPNLDVIRAALVPNGTLVVVVDPRWFAGAQGIQEVWIDINHKRYYADRILRRCPEMILSMEEFTALCQR